ncbi:MAG: S8 family serine peptidase [Caldilineaceae bacterium]
MSVYLGLALLTLSATPVQAQAAPPPAFDTIVAAATALAIPSVTQPLSPTNIPFAPGEILVGFHNQEGSRAAAATLSALSAQVVEQVTCPVQNLAKGGTYLLHVPEGQELAAIDQLQQDPNVAFAEPNALVYAADETLNAATAKVETPYNVRDPLYQDQQWYLQRINASRAWALAYASDGFQGAFANVQVAIIDSGIDVTHNEFRGRLLNGRNYVEPGTPPQDDAGHGTHVAGLMGAVTNNAEGIAGVAPKLKIDPRRVLKRVGDQIIGAIDDVAQAICDAADAGADIINLSLETSSDNTTLHNAVIYAASKGALLIAASGNSGASNFVSYPGAYNEVIAVAATTYSDRRASYSNAGQQVWLAAPGGERSRSMISTWPATVHCRDNTVGYCTSEGTSMAAAVVSGAAALIKSLRPSLNAEQIRQLLHEAVTPLNESTSAVGSGRLDLQKAVRLLLSGAVQPSTKSLVYTVAPGAAPFTATVRLDNPSLQVQSWRASLLTGSEWVQLQDAVEQQVSGTVTYGKPAYLTLIVTPTQLITGIYVSTLRVDALEPDNTVVSTYVDLNLSVVTSQPYHWYMPLVLQETAPPVTTEAYQWEIPAKAEDRVIYGMTDASTIPVTLPFTYTLRGLSYTTALITADGYVKFPDSSISPSLSNQCMPNLTDPAQAIYGWWANLDPSVQDAHVSTFAPAADRFVVEYENVASAAGISPSYRVSFQIVLYASGDVRLNYRDAPAFQGTLPQVTIGVEAHDGLFYNQVVCSDKTVQLGYLPTSQQSLLFKAQEDIY